VSADEERRLLDSADTLNCAEHAFAGAQIRDRIVGALETGCRLGEMLKIQNRHVLWETHQIDIPAEHAKDAESRRIPFEPKGRLSQMLQRRRFLGPKAYVFGTATGEYQGTIRTAWESLVLLGHGIEPTRTRAHGRVNRDRLGEIDLHWHDLRHEAACRWLARAVRVGRSALSVFGRTCLFRPVRPVLDGQPFEPREILVIRGREDEPIHVGNRSDLTVDERRRPTERFKSRPFLAVPGRRSLVVRQDRKRTVHDVAEISLQCCAAFPLWKSPTPIGQFVPDGRGDRALWTVHV
jgi:hypothetical protein